MVGFLFLSPQRVEAFVAPSVVGLIYDLARTKSEVKTEVKDTIWKTILTAAQTSFLSSLRLLVNQVSYETATYLGSGAQGQVPVYYTKQFGSWIREQGANAGGDFIEQFVKNASLDTADEFTSDSAEFLNKYDICSPDLSVTIKIALGLANHARDSRGLTKSRCNLKDIYQSGERQVELYKEEDYLKNLALTSFTPEATDIGAALTVFDEVHTTQEDKKKEKELERKESNGWIRPQDPISKFLRTIPERDEKKVQQTIDLQTQNFGTVTGNIFVDAAGIFLNQLALTAFNKLMDNLSKNTNTSSSNNYFSQGSSGGITEAAKKNSTILQARFDERADYNVLSQLSACSDEQNPGPSECVINQQFVQAIDQKLTVAEAIQQGLLDGNARVGYSTSGDVLSYKDGYPYRSLIILRKYRVLPVGWEIAAQYIKGHNQETKDVTLSDLIACFSDTDISYDGFEAPWCSGLVDPSWVLKLPKMFCGMEGYGSQIFGAEATLIPGEGDEKNYTVSVTRNNNYCADEQSCIKENSNGTCDLFGYCTEEKRRWVFNQTQDNSCQPRNNTCQNFKSETGTEVSFLENTLDYNNCDAGQVGCKQYALKGVYDDVKKKVDWKDIDPLDPLKWPQIYFNKNISSCASSGEGCHEYIRTKDNLDTNIIADASFEDSACVVDSGSPLLEGECEIHVINSGGTVGIYTLPGANNRWYMVANRGEVTAGIVQTEVDDGTKSLYIKGDGALYSNPMGPGITPRGFLPENFQFEPGHYYTLSARVFPKTSAAFAGFGLSSANHVDSTVMNQWQTLVVTFYYPFEGVTDNRIFVGSRSGEVYVDSVKLTAGRASTSYSDYGSNNVIYQKILPAYLEAACYDTGGRIAYRLKTDAPEECLKFAKKCNPDEVGCQSLTSLDTGITVTAKTTAQDSCPGSCVGYNTYVQQANAFNAKQAVNLVPSTAKACSAQAVGCTAFTNLDKLSEGGEAIEYYSAMRKCMKPDALKCAPFYTWEGSDESGYQLKVYSLQKDPNSRLGEEPLSTLQADDEALLCNATIFQKLPSEPGYNYDCRQFYAQNATVSYHLYQKTISCSDDCHPYRRELNTASECLAGNGQWDATQSRCLYYAIPGEGTRCAAANAGCQEYTGNIASNTRNVFMVSTFEDNDNPFDDWRDQRDITRTNNSLNLGGHSLRGDIFTKTVGEGVRRSKSYTVNFLARASTTTPVTEIVLSNLKGDRAVFETTGASISSEWRLYSFNLISLDHEVTTIPRPSNPDNIGEKLKLSFDGQVFIDNIRLIEVPNRFYLIRNSWVIPEECDKDFAGVDAPGYMLGCSQYKNSDSTTVNLHSFTDLCDDASAGCEAVIDTFNSSDYKANIVNDDNTNGACDPGEKSCIFTPADKIVNVIYDRAKQCEQNNKGCQRLGLGTKYDGKIAFSDQYLNNNPDRYNTTVCTAQAVGCSKWSSPAGDSYFKDPGDEVCEWRLTSGPGNQYAWYKKVVKRCAGNGPICTSDVSCSPGETCIDDTTDPLCSSTKDKTIGIGGRNNSVKQPSTWAGICEASQGGCTEYIDPISKFNENLILNPSYRKTDINSNVIEGWQPMGDGERATQDIYLTPQTLYILKGSILQRAPRFRIKLTCPNMNVLDQNNNFIPQTVIDYNNDWNSSSQFYIPITRESKPYALVSCKITIQRPGLDANPNDTVYLLKANVDYQLEQNLDKVSHNNLVNFDKGAVLFNERSQNGINKSSLTYNADTTYNPPLDGDSPNTRGNRNSNVLLKVSPDRTCSKWLNCISYIPDPKNPNNKICLDIAECQSFAEDGSCADQIVPTRKNLAVNLSSAKFLNATGYSKIGYSDSTFNSLSDYYSLASMSQVGETVEVKNGGFETVPCDDKWDCLGENTSIYDKPDKINNELKLNPLYKLSNQQIGTKFLAPEGKNLLRLGADVGSVRVIELASKEPIAFEVNKRYVLTFYSYGTGGSLDVGLQSGTNPIEYILNISKTDRPQQWVKRSIGFKATSPSYKLIFNNGDADSYLDEVKIESSLNMRCSDPNAIPPACNTPTLVRRDPQPQYIGPSCRLYPTENALACSNIDENNIKTQGIKGYCLETDPRNPGVCLLWYPVDRIASDPMEEGGGIDFEGKSVYYCLNAKDQCTAGNLKEPQLYCDRFLKVNTDYYWSGRLAENSTFTLPSPPTIFPEFPFFYPTETRKINFGGEVGAITIPNITRRMVDNYFGAYTTSSFEDSSKKLVTATRTSDTPPYKLTSFLPYYGSLNSVKCTSDGQPYNLNCSNLNGFSVVGDASKYWVGAYENHAMTITEQWDVCVPKEVLTLDFDDGCHENMNCQPGITSNVDEIFGIKYCDFLNTSLTQYTCQASGDYSESCHSGSQWNKKCTTELDENGRWVLKADDLGQSDEVACIAHCFNRIKEVKVLLPRLDPPPSRAFDVIKRLFPRIKDTDWQVYKWNNDLTKYEVESSPLLPGVIPGLCPPDGRSDINVLDSDYCAIKPIISNYSIDGNKASDINSGNSPLVMIGGVPSIIINGRGRVTFAFDTTTDIEQKPLTNISMLYGYYIDETPAGKLFSNGNFTDLNPRSFTTDYNYNTISSYPLNDYYRHTGDECGAGAEECFWIIPDVQIKDNWGYTDSISGNHDADKIRIIVQVPS